jgi:hypothetical protein
MTCSAPTPPTAGISSTARGRLPQGIQSRQAGPWLAKPENRDYFRSSANCERVRQWRLANPGHSRRKTAARPVALQDISNPQSVANEPFEVLHALPVTRRLAAATRSNCGTYRSFDRTCVTRRLVPSIRLFIRRGLDTLGRHAACGGVQTGSTGSERQNSSKPPPEAILDALAA